MAFMMMKKKRYKFQVECCVEELTEVPFVAAVLFAKVRLLDGGNFQEHSTREEVKNHTVRWNASWDFVCKMSANASTGVLDPTVLRISVRKECKGGRSYQKLGFVDMNLAELAGAGEAARRCLLEGYDARRRQDNSTLRLRIRMNMLSGDPLFKVPSPSLKHKQLSEQLAELQERAVPPSIPAPPSPPLAPALEREDCASSIASGSSGFGSLPKKRPALFGSELLAQQTQTTIISTELQLPQELDSRPEDEGSGQGGTLQRQRSGSDMLDGCLMTHAPGPTPTAPSGHCPACLHTHSRNSSNTSGEMSSKASGYGSSLSQQSQHSRQSSEGGDSSEGGQGGRYPLPTSSVHISRRLGPKLFIDRNRQANLTLTPSSGDTSSEVYLTPNNTLSCSPAQPDLIPRNAKRAVSPMSDNSIFKTPNSTAMSPVLPVEKNRFAVPSYFDRKKQDMISLARSAVNVLPLSNFHLFKQKSLNTIPDFIESQAAKEQQKEDESGLFHNFPFLTPLANRKNSLYDKNRLSSCNEDDFYVSPEPEVELRHPLRNIGIIEDKYVELRTLSLQAFKYSERVSNIETMSKPSGHSTPKQTKDAVDRETIAFARPFSNGQFRYSANTRLGHELQTSKSGLVISDNGNPFDSVNPLRHSYTVNCVTEKIVSGQKHPSNSVPQRNPSGGCLVMTETGSLDRAKAAMERRKPKGGAAGTMTLSAGPETDGGHGGGAVSGRVENTRVNPDSLINELLKNTNLEQVEDSAETSGLQLFIAKDGTAALGSRQIKSQMSQNTGAFKQVVIDAVDDR